MEVFLECEELGETTENVILSEDHSNTVTFMYCTSVT
jgi:hypothetical protein